jgi:hypothetical protein
MGLAEKLSEDLKSAMKSGDRTRTGLLRMLITRLKEARIAKRSDLDEPETYRVIKKEIRGRQEAIELFEKGGRADLAQREKAEIEILKSYLPPALSEEEVRALALDAVKEAEAGSPRDLGRVMKILMPRVAGRAEGAHLSKVVKRLLAESGD